MSKVPDDVVEPKADATKPSPVPFVGIACVALAFLAFVFLLVWLVSNTPRWDAELRAEAAAKVVREHACSEQGPRNAHAWAAAMRLQEPVVLCIWDAAWREGCGGIAVCSVGAEGRVYGVKCKVGDGAEQDAGHADQCWLSATAR